MTVDLHELAKAKRDLEQAQSALARHREATDPRCHPRFQAELYDLQADVTRAAAIVHWLQSYEASNGLDP